MSGRKTSIARPTAQAEEKGWLYGEVAGDTGLIRRLLNGEWDERECLVLPPGEQIVASHDEASSARSVRDAAWKRVQETIDLA